MIEIVAEPIDTGLVLATVQSPRAGACLLFVGTTREWTGGRQTQHLDYECYERMAKLKLHELEMEARHRWPLIGCSLVHRVGPVAVGEASVAIAVSSAHRNAAFEAGQWLIDTLKRDVPIWKRETWSDGTVEWLHPEADDAVKDDDSRSSRMTAS